VEWNRKILFHFTQHFCGRSTNISYLDEYIVPESLYDGKKTPKFTILTFFTAIPKNGHVLLYYNSPATNCNQLYAIQTTHEMHLSIQSCCNAFGRNMWYDVLALILQHDSYQCIIGTKFQVVRKVCRNELVKCC